MNQVGQESGNDSITSGRDLPWLQETAAFDVWAAWQVTYRDVVVLDAENRPVAAFNLTEHDLSVQSNYDALKTLLVDTANAQ